MAASSGLADTMITWKKATNGINLDFMVTLVPSCHVDHVSLVSCPCPLQTTLTKLFVSRGYQYVIKPLALLLTCGSRKHQISTR
jgi:hypothetical protein